MRSNVIKFIITLRSFRNIINYANAIKNIVYVLTQEEVLLDTKVEIGDDYYASTTSNMTDSIIVVPNEYDILDEQSIFILNYINYKYGFKKNLQTISAGEAVEKKEPSCIAGGNVN